MSSAYTRKKQPEVIRQELLDSAIRLAVRSGLTGISLQQVAEAAGVTKGGLLHHFPSKQALVDAVFDLLMEEFSASLEQAMAVDAEPHGRFTRAYLDLVDMDATDLDERSALWISLVTDPHLARRWSAWLGAQLAERGELEAGPALEAVRFAADGIWTGLFAGVTPANRTALLAYLRGLTRPTGEDRSPEPAVPS